jgi:hypothetical protein
MLDEGRFEELSENAKMDQKSGSFTSLGVFGGDEATHTDTKGPGVLRTSPHGIRVRFI